MRGAVGAPKRARVDGVTGARDASSLIWLETGVYASLVPMELQERVRCGQGSAEELSSVLYDSSEEVLLALLDNPRLNDDHLQVLLSRKNLGRKVVRELASRARLVRTYAVKLALVRHPQTPRNVSLPLLRHLYPFDLIKVAATPGTPAELRRNAEEAMIARLAAFSLGVRLSMARQGSARVAAALLADSEARVFQAAMENPRLTEEGVVKALRGRTLSPEAVSAIATHPRWSCRYEARLALIRHPATSLRCMLRLVEQVRRQDLADLTADRLMPLDRREYLARLVRQSSARQRAAGGIERNGEKNLGM